MKKRFGLGDRGGGDRIEWLRSVDEGFAADVVAGRVARAIDRRRSDLSLVEFVLDENQARAVYDVGDNATRSASTRPRTGSPASSRP